jgi:NAD(P)H-hydrate epimerase
MLSKIFSVEKIRKADQYTIDHEPISSVNLMERAARECYIWLAKKAKRNQEFAVFCGPGNNGGDGLVIARLLEKSGFGVQVFILNLSGRFSNDFQHNLERLQKTNCNISQWDDTVKEIPEFSSQTIIIDAIFGSGLSKELKGLPQRIVKKLNDLPHVKVAIDIPSGLFSDVSTVYSRAVIFQADYTLSFQFPKLAFLMPENEAFVGDWHILNIGLSEEYIQNTNTPYYYLNSAFIASIIKSRSKFSHKGSFGHVLVIAGDDSKMGAAILSGKAALKVGAGLVTLHHPNSAKSLVPLAVPELMSSLDKSEEAFTQLPDLAKYSHIAIGPGLGTRSQTAKALKLLIQQWDTPLVIDADALNILAENKTWLSFLPKGSILTPHIGEFSRLVGKTKNNFERLEKAIDFAEKYGIYLIVKGAHTLIATPTRKVFFNSSGNSGMATGGSGDVLTGMIIGLLAQNYKPIDAAILGVYLHGLSGDIAAENNGKESLIAGDVINHIGKAYQRIKE